MTAQVVTRCRVCGRRLTDPESVKLGVGPVCLRRLKQLLDERGEEPEAGPLEVAA